MRKRAIVVPIAKTKGKAGGTAIYYFFKNELEKKKVKKKND